jgi:hypothetical protein
VPSCLPCPTMPARAESEGMRDFHSTSLTANRTIPQPSYFGIAEGVETL